MFWYILSNVPYTTGYFKQCYIPQCIVRELWFLASHSWLIISRDFVILDALIENNNKKYSTQNAHCYKSFTNTQYGNSIFHVQWKFTLHWVSALHKHDEKERHKHMWKCIIKAFKNINIINRTFLQLSWLYFVTSKKHVNRKFLFLSISSHIYLIMWSDLFSSNGNQPAGLKCNLI